MTRDLITGISSGLTQDYIFSEGFTPTDLADLIGWWDADDLSSITFQTGSGLGGTVSSVDNKANPGTNPLEAGPLQGLGSSYPAYIMGLNGKPCFSNLDAADAALISDDTSFFTGTGGRTFIAAQRVREDGLFAFWHGGTSSSGTSYVNASQDLRWSDIEGNGDVTMFNNVDNAFGLVSTAIVFNDNDDMDYYLSNSTNVFSLDPKDSALGTSYVPMGRYNGGGGTARLETYEAIVYDRALSAGELTQVLEYLATKWAPSTKKFGVVLAGQSNSVGYYTLTGATDFEENEQRFKVYNYADSLVDYNPAVAISDSTGTNYSIFTDGNADYSMGPSLMDYLARRLGGDIVCIPANVGGADLTTANEWGERTTDFDTDTLFGAMNERIRLAQALDIQVIGVAWQQGEADANSAVAATESEYKDAMDDLIEDNRAAATSFASLAWSIGVLQDDIPDPPHTNLVDVQDAQLSISLSRTDIADTSDPTTFPTAADNLHYNNVGLDAVGALHAEKLIVFV